MPPKGSSAEVPPGSLTKTMPASIRSATRIAWSLSVVNTYEHKVQPVVDRGYAASRDFADVAKRGIDKTVLPVLGGVVGSVLSIGDIAKDHRVRAALERFQPAKPAPKRLAVKETAADEWEQF